MKKTRIKLVMPNIEKNVKKAIKKGEVSDWETIRALAERDDIEFYREDYNKVTTISADKMRYCLDQNWEMRG
jgi:hypothetical protein